MACLNQKVNLWELTLKDNLENLKNIQRLA